MSKDEWKKLGKNEWTNWVGVVGRVLLAYALIFPTRSDGPACQDVCG